MKTTTINEQTNRKCWNDRRSESFECDYITDQSQDNGCKPKTRVVSLTSFIKVAVTRHKKEQRRKKEKKKEREKKKVHSVYFCCSCCRSF